MYYAYCGRIFFNVFIYTFRGAQGIWLIWALAILGDFLSIFKLWPTFKYKKNKVKNRLNLIISWGPIQSELFYNSDILQKWWMERKELIDHMPERPVSDAGCQKHEFWMWKPSVEVCDNSSSSWLGVRGFCCLPLKKVETDLE